jgi:hypothetical protein
MTKARAAAGLLALALLATAAASTQAQVRATTPPLNTPRVGPVTVAPTPVPIPPEDCMGVDPNQMVITGSQTPIDPSIGTPGSWMVRANKSSQSLVIAYLDYKSQAETVITLAKARHWNRICFVGTRGGGSYMYPLAAGE